MDTTTRRDYRTAGEGVAFPFGEPTAKEKAAIEMIVSLDARRKRYLGKRSKAGLYRLARDYQRRGMPMMAVTIRAEAREL